MKAVKRYEWRIISEDGLVKPARRGSGWSADSVTGTYETAEDAISALEREGWKYEDFVLVETYRLED